MMSLKVLRGFLHKELKQVLRDPKMKFVLFISPIIQLIVFGVAISTDVKNIQLWANPRPTDHMLQHIYQHSVASKWFVPAGKTNTIDPFGLLQGEEVDAALVAPPGGVTQTVGRGIGRVQLLVDATNVLQAQSVEAYIKNIASGVVQSDLKLAPLSNPINFSVRVLFNPTLETAFFMVPGVMCLLLCVVAVILTNMSITQEKERGTFEMLISAPISSADIIFGKTIPYVLIAMTNVPIVLIVATLFFHLPIRGSILVLFLVSLAFVCAAVAIGTLISTFTKNQQQSMLGGILFLFPAILLSGLMFPIENMPMAMKWAAYLNPLYHFLKLVRNIALKGGELSFVVFHSGVLVLMATVIIYLSYKRFRTTLQ